MDNILLYKRNTPYQTAPFSEIKLDDFLPAIKQFITKSKEEINALCDQKEEATFYNTCERYEFSSLALDEVIDLFFNLHHAETNPDFEPIARDIAVLKSNYSSDVLFNEQLFLRIKHVYDRKDVLDLSEEQKTLLNEQYKSFVRNGALLDDVSKEKLRKLDEDLQLASISFGNNLLKEINHSDFCIEDIKALEGLPESYIQAAKEAADKKGKKGWLFSLQATSYIPFMTYIKDVELRKKMAEKKAAICNKGDELDNSDNIKKIIALKSQRASLMNYENHSAFVLENRMADTPAKVADFEQELLSKTLAKGKKEYDTVCDFSKSIGGPEKIQSYDFLYYSEKLKKKLFSLDEQLLKPYFELDKVIKGAFKVAENLFEITFERVNDIDVYHKEVKTYLVKKKGNVIAVFYGDYFPRVGKNPGAWMTVFRNQYKYKGEHFIPHVSNVCNFTKPTSDQPSLLSFEEVTTLFHEFGHALHGILSNVNYPSLSGANTYWDFVELPSQILENWCYQPEVLELFAKHYKTGEQIPQQLIDKIRASYTFMIGIQTVRQITLGILDLSWHTVVPSQINSVVSFEKEVTKPMSLFPDAFPKNCISTSFSHIFQGGYDSGYYSYKWAEVLEADAFEEFLTYGVLSSEIGRKFVECVLSKGGTEHPMVLYKKFRGREPNNKAYLKRADIR